MIPHNIYAEILDGDVKNVIVCNSYPLANRLTKACYGSNAFAVDCTQYPCAPGDRYRDNNFYRINKDGTEELIEYVPTQDQQIASLTTTIDVATEYMVDLDFRMSCRELEL